MGAGFKELGLHGSESLLTEPNLRCGGVVLLFASYYNKKAAKTIGLCGFFNDRKDFFKVIIK